jgi:D-alanyl-D-alanine-carboxypeptidase/D-alanyl-D-alanine-endopeptidase
MLGPVQVREILAERVDDYRLSPGYAVEISDDGRRQFVSFGHTDLVTRRPVTPDTIFEIGSVTKLFTSLLLADMVVRGEVALDDPVGDCLPSEVRVPGRGGRRITLAHLATHTSGLPRMPTNFAPADRATPYADYTVERLYEFLGSYKLTRAIGKQVEYSNLGFMLLGHALASAAGSDYEKLVTTRICEPLGLGSTFLNLPPAMAAQLAVGHDDSLDPVPSWDMRPLPGAGGLLSNTADLTTFAEAFGTETPLSPAMEIMKRPRDARTDRGLGKVHPLAGGVQGVGHEGGTGGYRSCLCYAFDWKRAVVVLSNSAVGGAGELGTRLLDPSRAAPWHRREAPVDPALFDRYSGVYRMTSRFAITVTRDGDRLYVQATGQERIRAFPASDRHFFHKVVAAQLTFEPGKDREGDRLVLHQNSRDQIAKRVE